MFAAALESSGAYSWHPCGLTLLSEARCGSTLSAHSMFFSTEGALSGAAVVVVGATGGLGRAVCAAALRAGAAHVVVGARDVAAASTCAAELRSAFPGASLTPLRCDLRDAAEVSAFVAAAFDACGPALSSHARSAFVNAAGVDVRKPLSAHSLADVDLSLSVNVRGAVLLTQAALVPLRAFCGVVVHLGGFADARLAFPYYSVDAATRAAVRTFAEAANRELALTGRPAQVAIFNPPPADTTAERPFHALWRKMGARVEPPDRVAEALIRSALVGRRMVHVHSLDVALLSALNALCPTVADALYMSSASRAIHAYFEPLATAAESPHAPLAVPAALG